MAATIKIKNSSTAGAAPTSSDLVQGELAVNVTDKRLYTENASGTVVELGTNPSVPVTFPDGSASAPSLTNDGDTNTGLFFPAADTVGIATGGTERARVDSSGNLGLGVTPSAWTLYNSIEAGKIGNGIAGYKTGSSVLVISNAYYNSGWKYANTAVASLYEQDSAAHKWYYAASGTAGNAITFTQAMTLDASGNLVIGNTSATYKLDVWGSTSIVGHIRNNTTGTNTLAQLQFSTNNNYDGFSKAAVGAISENLNTRATALGFYSEGSDGTLGERARIDSSGNLLVGTTSSSLTSNTGFKVIPGNDSYIGVVTAQSTNANSGIHLYSTGAGAYRFYVGNGGTVYATSTTISAISDIRFKENVRDLDAGLAEIMALKPRLYDWKEGKGADIKNARGFIAQEFEEVFPDLIDEWKDPSPEGEEPYKSVRQDLIPVLVKAIQELKAEFDAYKAAHP